MRLAMNKTFFKEDKNSLKQLIKMAVYFFIPLLYLSMAPEIPGRILPVILDPYNRSDVYSFALLLLVLPIIWAGKKIFLEGLYYLKEGIPSISTLVTIACGTALLHSLYVTVQMVFNGSPYVEYSLYYESVGAIILVTLWGKYLEISLYSAKEETGKTLLDIIPQVVLLVKRKEEIEVAVNEIAIGDIIHVKQGEIVPVDGVIVKGSAELDESLMTGEVQRATRQKDEYIYASTKVLQGDLFIETLETVDNTMFSRISAMMKESDFTTSPLADKAEKIAMFLIPAVLVVAIVAGLSWFFEGAGAAFAVRVFISVLIIACPSALGLAVPISTMIAVRRSARFGIVFRAAAAVELANNISTIVFDKTGTITEGRPVLEEIVTFNEVTHDGILAMAASLEAEVNPNLADVLYKKLSEPLQLALCDELKVLPGSGIEAKYNGKLVRLGRVSLINKYIKVPQEVLEKDEMLSKAGKTVLHLSVGRVFCGYFVLIDVIRPDAVATMEALKKADITSVMVSGGNRNLADYVGQTVGVAKILHGLSVEDRVELIKSFQLGDGVVAMVGDGLNDMPTLKQANIGIAFGSKDENLRKVAQVVLVRENLLSIVKMIEVSKLMHKNIKENIVLALGYNIIGVPIAAGILYIFGGPLMHPLVAAFVMFLSTISILFNALRLKKEIDNCA